MAFDHSRTKSNRPFGMVILVFLAITLVVSSFPQASAGAVTCKFKHKVVQGETLIYIADLYQVGWEKIADANNLSAPYVVVEGQVLCIPEGTKPSNTTSTTTTTSSKGTTPTLQVVPGMNEILVSVENFPGKTNYYVNVSPAKQAISYRLGHFKTNKEGDFTDWFRMPYYINRSPQMTLCVKNVYTDKVSCIKYDDIYNYFPFVNGKCTAKEGR